MPDCLRREAKEWTSYAILPLLASGRTRLTPRAAIGYNDLPGCLDAYAHPLQSRLHLTADSLMPLSNCDICYPTLLTSITTHMNHRCGISAPRRKRCISSEFES